MGADEEGTSARLKAHRRALVDPKIKQHRGRIVRTAGDGMLVEFTSVVDAVCCAVDVQHRMVKRNAELPQEKRIEFRVGINLGDIMIDGSDIVGDGVNVAARLEAIAEPGGIFISRQVYDQIEGKLALRFRRLGPRDLKNIAKPVEVFAIDGIGRSNERSIVEGPEPIQEIKYCWAFDGYASPMRSQAAGQFW
jgi:class 3 adenylate cyclase